jgi:CDP-glycerol glycerophosphotransferase (TagB/SpsB family)
LSKKYKNFQVKETGWSKLDPLFCIDEKINTQKEDILKKSNAKIILLYAPTFSPSLTSAPALLEEFKKIADDKRFYTIVKSHDKMDTQIIDQYKILQNQNFVIDKSDDITPLLKLSDLMISDTSSVVYEFLLLNKPLITLNSNSEHIKWENIKTPVDLIPKIESYLKGDDPFKIQRDEIFKLYHPYRDGKSSKRVVDATLEYIREFKVPKKRDIPLHRKIKLLRKFGFKPLFS